MKPESLINLINELKSMPGISKKQAERIAYHIIQSNNEAGNALADSIKDANALIHKCEVCHHLTQEQQCHICTDSTRSKKLVIVETPLDVFKFEEAQNDFRPRYHVLSGLINVSKGISFDDLNIEGLKERAKDYSEVILALSPTLEGIVTANFVKSLLNEMKVTQLAQGIPLGAAMEYVDELTLQTALANRKEVE